MVIFTLVFGRLAKLPSDGAAPYALLVFAGLLPWSLFSAALTGASESMVANSNLIGKVCFPRIIIPAATLVTSLIDFLLSLLILAAMKVWYHFLPGWQIVLLPILVLHALIASLGPGLWVTALNIKYPDFRVVIPFLVQLGLYVSPVGFGSALVSGEWRWLHSLSPLVGNILSFSWCLLGGESGIYWPGALVSLAVVAFFLWLGIWRFRATERTFADLN